MKFQDLKIGLDEDLEEKLQWLAPNYESYRIRKKSIDARRKNDPHFVYSLDVYSAGETPPEENYELEKLCFSQKPVLVVGSGPAGLFAAIRLVERGIACILIERGSATQDRMKRIARYWRYGELDQNDNVCFGEGGAGMYSDGKLITRIKSPYIDYVMQRLVQFGAPEEIRYLANPHVGSDRIRRVIPKIRDYLLKNGCEIRFQSRVTDLLLDSDKVCGVEINETEKIYGSEVVLATGHSAEDVFRMLQKHRVHMTGKSFALGLRIEHPQKYINELQYRDYAEHPKLEAANYRISQFDKKTGIGVYSFCMCPGGYVLSSTTDLGTVVSNGMSNYQRNSPFANAAIVVSIDHEKNFGSDLYGGLHFRKEIETKAYQALLQAGGKKELPAQKLKDFFENKKGSLGKNSSLSGAVSVNLQEILPAWISEKMQDALFKIEKRMPGFSGDHAQVFGVESRTSCPVRVERDAETFESFSHASLYPCGEGAGYAGGITSAACDGIRVAEAIFEKYS